MGGCDVYVFAVKIENRHEMRVLQGMFAEPYLCLLKYLIQRIYAEKIFSEFLLNSFTSIPFVSDCET